MIRWYELWYIYYLGLQLKEFRVIGRKLPSEKLPKPLLYRMRIFAPDEIAAKSRFWYYLKKLRKVKKTVGEVVYCGIVRETVTAVSNLISPDQTGLSTCRLLTNRQPRSRTLASG